MNRNNSRNPNELRKITLQKEFSVYPEGSIFISSEDTKILCNVSIIEHQQPHHLRGSKKGWLTAEYSLLPRSTLSRMNRESSIGRVKGRTLEIQRLIGRALRSIIDLDNLGPHTIWVDCDVIQADGGTRTTSINGAFIALVLAIDKFKKKKNIKQQLIKNYLSAISVGVVKNFVLLDLDYHEDNNAQVDMNVVMDANENYIEIQATGEEYSFNAEQLTNMLTMANKGCKDIITIVKKFLMENKINELP
jgi:ribonuclease PH